MTDRENHFITLNKNKVGKFMDEKIIDEEIVDEYDYDPFDVWDNYDWCYECTGYGDDYHYDEDGELVSNCNECPHNRSCDNDYLDD